jgi:hypothetical protein
MSSPWRAALVDAPTQAGKTWKCFQILKDRLLHYKPDEQCLTIFIAQANCITSTSQIIQRASNNTDINSVIPSNNISRSSVKWNGIDDIKGKGNFMIVDFWNARNINNIIKNLKNTVSVWTSIIIVVDECDQGGIKGVENRLRFITNLERLFSDKCTINIILITATVANLSKSILKIALKKDCDNNNSNNSNIVGDLVHSKIVQHFFAVPHDSYVPASWFQNAKDSNGEHIWKKLSLPKPDPDTPKNDHIRQREEMIMTAIKGLEDVSKELCLVVTSTRVEDHSDMVAQLFACGFNVCVELNGTCSKNFKVTFKGDKDNIGTWNIPYTIIERKADKGCLKTFYNCNKKKVLSGIECKEDISMSHVLQAALFMTTDIEDRIKHNICNDEYNKLDAISHAICHMEYPWQRPDDYPIVPRVALIAGHLAGRGISIQNPFIDFTCTSFCFTDVKDIAQRGASNAQRFGRACGMLKDVFSRENRLPKLIATEAILQDAIANEKCVVDNLSRLDQGALVSLKDLIGKKEWEQIVKDVKKSLRAKVNVKKLKKTNDVNVLDGVKLSFIEGCVVEENNQLVAKMIRYLFQSHEKISIDEFMKGIEYKKSCVEFSSNVRNGQSPRSKYGKLWLVDGEYISINPVIKSHIQSLLTNNK